MSLMTQSVRIGTHSSPATSSPVGVPQSSVLGPLLFSVYTSPISTIARSHHVSQQQYADDTQLFLTLSPANYSQSINVGYFNLAQTPSIFGFVKTAWPLIQINQLLFCSVPHKGLNLCPGFNLLM